MADELLDALEQETAPSPSAAVIWMHGLGADGYDFVDVPPLLGLPPALAVRFVFPHAPMQPVTINGGMVMRAWYDVRHDTGARREDEAGVRRSQERVEALIDAEVDLCTGADGYSLRARLNVHLPGVDRDAARSIVDGAEQTCPYSKATRGNIDVEINLIDN